MVVDDLAAATEFFVELGLVQGEGPSVRPFSLVAEPVPSV